MATQTAGLLRDRYGCECASGPRPWRERPVADGDGRAGLPQEMAELVHGVSPSSVASRVWTVRKRSGSIGWRLHELLVSSDCLRRGWFIRSSSARLSRFTSRRYPEGRRARGVAMTHVHRSETVDALTAVGLLTTRPAATPQIPSMGAEATSSTAPAPPCEPFSALTRPAEPVATPSSGGHQLLPDVHEAFIGSTPGVDGRPVP